MSTSSIMVLSFLASCANFNIYSIVIKVILYFSKVSFIYNDVLAHCISYLIYQDKFEFICLCTVVSFSKSKFEETLSHSLAVLIQVLIFSGPFLDFSGFVGVFLSLILNYVTTQKNKNIWSLSEYHKRIEEENQIYMHEIEAHMANPTIKKSHIRRSSTILANLKRLRHLTPHCVTENSDNDSPSSDISHVQSRKSSFNYDSNPETPDSNSSNFDQILPGISNNEIKEIINSLISQEYLVLNPKKFSDNEIDIIAIALEAKSVFTQSIESLPGSSHRVLSIKQKKKRRDSIRSMIEVFEPLGEVLESIGDWDFDCFELIQITKDPAFEVGLYIFNTLSLSDSFNIDNQTLKKFLTSVEHGYNRGNFYHNSIHAADVTASTLFLIQKGLSRCGNLVDLDVFALVVAALCHDIGHPGLNNAFLVASYHELAHRYNDQSCLENMHSNKTFAILNSEGCNITANLNKADFQRFRKSVVAAILSTDLQVHFMKLSEFKANVDKQMDISDDKFRTLAIQMCLKCADIGHGARKIDIHINWTRLITKEFFKQGDKEIELGIALSPLCDRENCIISKSQIGFLEFLVRPLFKIWEEFIELHNEADEDLEVRICMKNINANIGFWNEEYQRVQAGEAEFELGDEGPLLDN